MTYNHAIQYGFITGLPRSGTTLLALTLNNVKEVLSLLESELTLRIRQSYYAEPFDNFEPVKVYLSSVAHRFDELPYEIDINKLLKVLSVKEASFHEQLLKVSLEFKYLGKSNKGVQFVLEKNPDYAFKLTQLKKDFKASKFIWMTRNYKGFVNSRIEKKNPKNKINNPIFLGYLWNEIHNQLFCNSDLDFLIVEYESLTSDKNKELQRILNYLGVRDEEKEGFFAPINFKNELKLSGRDKEIKFADLSAEVSDKRNFAWKKNLSGRVITYLDVICAKNYAKLKNHEVVKINMLKKVFVYSVTFHWFVLSKVYTKQAKRAK